ncbi:MAG: PTS sugar transporter subunit IIC [Endomicrobium sp.]|jgi:PTS system mannose-specific IIC component|nr:PTS sugar transporter subunit IIC [Endomicrobium sp.]
MMLCVNKNIVFLAFVSALCSADVIAIGQLMICRPIFCAPLIGFFMGDVSAGLWIGIIVEMIWINAVPIGVAVPIDVSVLGTLSTFWMCKYFMGLHEAAIWGLVLAIPFAYLYKLIDIWGRDFNTKLMHWVERRVQNGEYRYINIGVAVGLFFFIAKAFLFYIFSMTIGGWIYRFIYSEFPNFVLKGFQKAWYLLPICGFGMAMCNFRKIRILFRR